MASLSLFFIIGKMEQYLTESKETEIQVMQEFQDLKTAEYKCSLITTTAKVLMPQCSAWILQKG